LRKYILITYPEGLTDVVVLAIVWLRQVTEQGRDPEKVRVIEGPDEFAVNPVACHIGPVRWCSWASR
jgi:hypothetical protein